LPSYRLGLLRPVLFGILGVFVAAPVAHAQALPQMEAADLNGRIMTIPQDLRGSPRLLIVAFEEEQQKEIDRLLPLIEAAKNDAPGLSVWELPLIDDPGPIGRFFIENGMKAGIPDEAMRARVISLYVKDRRALAAALGLGPEQIVYLVALDANGNVAASRPAREIATQQQITALLKGLRGKSR
jgi:hypothetical protein